MEVQIYKHKEEFEKRRREIQESDLPRRNRRLILDFLDDMSARVSAARMRKYAFLFLRIGPLLGKDVDKYSVRDFRRLVGRLNDLTKREPPHGAASRADEKPALCSEWYRADMRAGLKVFVKWLKGSKYNPRDFEWLRTSVPSNAKKSRVEEGQTLDVDEVERLIATATNTRDKALISVAYETAARPSELLTLRIGNVTFDPYGAVVHIQHSKTRPRPIRIINAATYLRAWINIHPLRANPDALLWLRQKANPRHDEIIGVAALNRMLKGIARRAGVMKKVYPYILRHSRTTHLVQQYPDQIVKRITGHTPTSKHFEVYLHMSNRDVEEAILKRHGLLRPEDEIRKELEKPLLCWNCKAFNSPEARICENCNFSLEFSDMASTLKQVKEIQGALPTLMKMAAMSNEELLRVRRREELRKLAKRR
ncbi:MAG: tyrosine-type recombinase/integrase [Candidatus Aenigmarchaeota archaeon]|nr:tyrosine-type recombinase/integrase [Candidatus Aenigmarchaeota archaeon]